MKISRRAVIAAFVAFGSTGISLSKAAASTPPAQADLVVVDKSRRLLAIFREKKLIGRYKIALGTSPDGAKKQQGDGRTPEGTYFIDRRNANSSYHLSLGISYPNVNDVSEARSRGVSAGGDIFIHGGPRTFRNPFKRDWTAGCISVSDKEIEEIWAMVPMGTTIVIQP